MKYFLLPNCRKQLYSKSSHIRAIFWVIWHLATRNGTPGPISESSRSLLEMQALGPAEPGLYFNKIPRCSPCTFKSAKQIEQSDPEQMICVLTQMSDALPGGRLSRPESPIIRCEWDDFFLLDAAGRYSWPLQSHYSLFCDIEMAYLQHPLITTVSSYWEPRLRLVWGLVCLHTDSVRCPLPHQHWLRKLQTAVRFHPTPGEH